MLIKDKLWDCDDLYIQWLKKSKGLGKTSIYHYYTYYKDVKHFEILDQRSLSDYIQKKKNTCIVRSFVKSLLDFLKINNVDIEFEMPKVSTGKKKKKIIKSYSKEEMEIMRKGCYAQNQYVGILFDLLHDGALRRSEIPTIQINSFNWDQYIDDYENKEKYIQLNILGKGKKERVVLIKKSVVTLILQNLFEMNIINPEMDRNGFLSKLKGYEKNLFENIKDGWIVWKKINRVSNRVLKRSMRPHEIRHHRATELQDMGVNIRDIQQYLGHSTPQITEIYLHTTAKTSIKHIGDKLNE